MKQDIKILLIYTGGTIGMVKDYKSGSLRAFDFEKLSRHIPELKQLDCQIDTVSFVDPIDSSNMNPGHWANLATIIEDHYATHQGFVVLHGSDTMSYTASALGFMLENLDRPVILTGSQLPIGDLRTDAKENLITSIQMAALRQGDRPMIREVGLYFEYKLYRGNRTTKINAEHFQAFASPNYPPLAESGLHLKVFEDYLWRGRESKRFKVHRNLDTRVALLKLFPGLNRAVLESVLGIPDLKVLVLETYGSGNAPTEAWFLNALEGAIDNGLHIVNVTQCAGGGVIPGRYETSERLQAMQVVNGADITSEAALTKAMYLLGSKVPADLFKTVFETPLRGEML